jgi:hypothetical protein
MALVSISRRGNINRPIMDQSLLQSSQTHRHQPVTRSQSIKIPRYDANVYGHPNNLIDESTMRVWEEDASQLEEQYKSATLRMYYRITDYRIRNSSLYTNDDSVTNTPSSYQLPIFPELSDTAAIQRNNEQEATANNATYISEENGAIFEMDL